MRRTIIALLLLIILMVPFLSACDAGDLQVLINYAKLWAMVHDITDADGNINPGAATRFAVGEAFGFGTTGDAEGDAVIDSARTLKDIRDAQVEANQGWEALYAGKHINDSVLPHYNQAIKLRSQDWSYYNERGIAQLENLDNPNALKDAQADFNKASEYGNQKPQIYIQMLKQRAEAMEKYTAHVHEEHSLVTKEFYMEQSRTYSELAGSTGDNRYVLLKQQADTNIQQGYYITRGPTK